MNTTSIYKSPEGEQAVMDFYDRILAAWPVAHQDIRIKTRHGDTFVIASGPITAPPVILLHGANSNALAWMGDITALASEFRVFAVDIPGDPGRSAPNRLDWNGPGYVDWMEDVLAGLQISKAAVAGISQGGWNALKFAVNHPECVSKLILLSPGGVVKDRPSFLFKAILYSIAGKRGIEALNRLIFGRMEVDATAVRFMELILTQVKSRFEPVKLFTIPELSRLNMPVLLIGGGRDVIRDNVKIQRRLSGLVPDLSSHIYPEEGHVLINQAAVMVPFLK